MESLDITAPDQVSITETMASDSIYHKSLTLGYVYKSPIA